MSKESPQFQPGAMLHDAIVGAFRSQGLGFEAWCLAKGHNPSNVRSATFGQSKGPKGRAMLAEIIADAGQDIVEAAYRARLKEHLGSMERGAA